MTELSPAAEAVWDAAWADTPVRCGDIEGTRRAQIAAALRAAADQVVPEHFISDQSDSLDRFDAGAECRNQEIRDRLLAIADELAAH